MAIANDYSISYANKQIKYTATGSLTAGRYSVNQLYSYLQDTFDESGQMDDQVPMSAQTPTEYTLINGWFMDYPSTNSLSGGAIQTNGLSANVYTLQFGGTYTNAVESDLLKTVTGAAGGNSTTGILLHFDNTNKKWWVRSGNGNSFTASNSTVSVSSGTGTGIFSASGQTGEYIFSNIYTLGTLSNTATQLYIQQGSSVTSSTISPWWSVGHIDILVQVKEAGNVLANSDLTVFAREWGYSYDHFVINAPSGRNAVPLSQGSDGFNTSTTASLSAITGVTATFYSTPILRDLDNGNGAQPYKVEINCNSYTLDDVYEYLKYLTNRERITDIDAGAGDVRGWVYTEASLSSAYTNVKAAPFGLYTGTFFGARGVYLTNLNSANIKSFSLIDMNGVTQDPPNQVSVLVTSVVSGDTVFVTRLNTAGGNILKNQYTLSANAQGSSVILISGSSISGETPKYGKIRVTRSANLEEHSYSFTAWSGSAFSLSSGVTTLSAYTNVDYAYVPIIDESVSATSTYKTVVQSTDIPVLIRVRKKGIQPFEIEGTVASNGLSIAAIRTTDSIVS